MPTRCIIRVVLGTILSLSLGCDSTHNSKERSPEAVSRNEAKAAAKRTPATQTRAAVEGEIPRLPAIDDIKEMYIESYNNISRLPDVPPFRVPQRFHSIILSKLGTPKPLDRAQLQVSIFTHGLETGSIKIVTDDGKSVRVRWFYNGYVPLIYSLDGVHCQRAHDPLTEKAIAESILLDYLVRDVYSRIPPLDVGHEQGTQDKWQEEAKEALALPSIDAIEEIVADVRVGNYWEWSRRRFVVPRDKYAEVLLPFRTVDMDYRPFGQQNEVAMLTITTHEQTMRILCYHHTIGGSSCSINGVRCRVAGDQWWNSGHLNTVTATLPGAGLDQPDGVNEGPNETRPQ